MILILNICGRNVVMHVIEELLPFDCLHFNIFSILIHNLVTNGWIFMKLILSIYNYGVVIYIKSY